jgi:hypothetical protein
MLLSKKIFIVSSSILGVTLVFWGIYLLSFKKPTEKQAPSIKQNTAENATTKTTSTAKTERIQQITDESILAPTLTNNDDFLKYYSQATGKVYSVDLLSLKKQVISDTNILNLIDVFWSPSQDSVITKFSGNSAYPLYSIYNYTTRSGNKLSEAVGTVAWQNDKKILYTFFDKKTKEKSINIADADGKNWHKITNFSSNNLAIAPIPKSGFISFWNKPDAFIPTIMQSTPVLGGETKTLSSDVFGADYLWNTDGTFLLRSNVDQKGGHAMELGFSNNLGGEYKKLGIPTFVSKCAWSKNSDFIFYALPGNISEKNILPNDYINDTFTTHDTFWKVNLKTGEKSRLVPLEELTTAYDATNLFLSTNESYLFFTNKIDGKLYRIKL